MQILHKHLEPLTLLLNEGNQSSTLPDMNPDGRRKYLQSRCNDLSYSSEESDF